MGFVQFLEQVVIVLSLDGSRRVIISLSGTQFKIATLYAPSATIHHPEYPSNAIIRLLGYRRDYHGY
jgi:hypothetical protein